jgi:hypothetical protein
MQPSTPSGLDDVNVLLLPRLKGGYQASRIARRLIKGDDYVNAEKPSPLVQTEDQPVRVSVSERKIGWEPGKGVRRMDRKATTLVER